MRGKCKMQSATGLDITLTGPLDHSMADSVTKNELLPIQDIISSPAPINAPQPASVPALHSPSSTTASAATTAATADPTTPPAVSTTSATPAPASTTRLQTHTRPFTSTSITKKFLQKSQHSPSSTSSSSAAQTAPGANASTPVATGSVTNANGASKSTSRACASAYIPDSFYHPIPALSSFSDTPLLAFPVHPFLCFQPQRCTPRLAPLASSPPSSPATHPPPRQPTVPNGQATQTLPHATRPITQTPVPTRLSLRARCHSSQHPLAAGVLVVNLPVLRGLPGETRILRTTPV